MEKRRNEDIRKELDTEAVKGRINKKKLKWAAHYNRNGKHMAGKNGLGNKTWKKKPQGSRPRKTWNERGEKARRMTRDSTQWKNLVYGK